MTFSGWDGKRCLLSLRCVNYWSHSIINIQMSTTRVKSTTCSQNDNYIEWRVGQKNKNKFNVKIKWFWSLKSLLRHRLWAISISYSQTIQMYIQIAIIESFNEKKEQQIYELSVEWFSKTNFSLSSGEQNKK